MITWKLSFSLLNSAEEYTFEAITFLEELN